MATDLLTRLTSYVKSGAVSVSAADQEFIQACLDAAIELVAKECGAVAEGDPSVMVFPASVPLVIVNRAIIEVGSELYNRRQAPNGISQFAANDGSAIRVARDPMVAAYPILRPYLAGGFA